ncbi:hypothetical protein Lal_00001442 [Lupinus albus]|nr:hypothetical protein Lal_00001442 [Lupinus albus]
MSQRPFPAPITTANHRQSRRKSSISLTNPPPVSSTMATELDSVEPQSLKKLSFKSLKRALDLFSPIRAQLPPRDA